MCQVTQAKGKSEEDENDNQTVATVFDLDTGDTKLLEAYCEMENECFKSVPGGVKRLPGQLLEDIAEGERCFWLSQSGEYVGFLSVKICFGILDLESFGVSQAYRGRGIGQMALEWVESFARKQDCTRIRMVCADCNPAIRLYEKNGYQREEALSHWYVTRDEKRNLLSEGEEDAKTNG